MQQPFNDQLAKALGDLKRNIEAQQKSLYQPRPECACNPEGLCAHHAEVWSRLQEANKQFEITIRLLNDPNGNHR